jgi:hypothetical protein
MGFFSYIIWVGLLFPGRIGWIHHLVDPQITQNEGRVHLIIMQHPTQ